MATVAKNTVFKLGTSGTPGTPSDISAKLNSVKPSWDADSLESTTFGTSGAKAFNAGLTGGTISIEGNWDATIDAHLAALLGVDGIAFEHGPEGSTTGLRKNTGTCIVTKYEPPNGVGTLQKFTLELTTSGAITRATYP